MKRLILILFILFSSCSRSIYYAYENSADESYCTFEVNDKEIIYRAVSKEHYVINSSPNKHYIHIQTPNGFYKSKEPKIDIGSVLVYLKDIESNTSGISVSSDTIPNHSGYLFYNKIKEKDSLELVKNEELMKKERLFSENDLFWFPPYLKKVKQIDYDKFSLPLKKKYLKTLADKDRPKK